MRKEQVPQEDNATFGGERKLVYATDDSGRYTSVTTSGWKVEEVVTSGAVEEFQRMENEARARVQRGEASPLEYHMYARRMDVVTLAQSTSLFAWRVRRHLQPRHFATLKPKLLQRYADALGLSVDELRRLPD
jgi:hypothetical protein